MATSPRSPRHLRRLAVGAAAGVAIAMSAGVAPGVAAAAPAPALPAAPGAMSLPGIPFDSEIAEGIRILKQAGADQIALQAAQAVIGSFGQLSSNQVAARSGIVPAAGTDPLAVLRALGIQPLTPSVAPFCTASTADNPLGLVTAGAGAVAGPWPLKSEPTLPFPIPGVTLPKLNLVDKGETAYAFVPASVSGGTGGKMQVAWFNVNTLKGGFADLDPLAKTSPILGQLPLLNGVRLAPVKTEGGTILSAVYGTAMNGGKSCYFLPAVGIVNA